MILTFLIWVRSQGKGDEKSLVVPQNFQLKAQQRQQHRSSNVILKTSKNRSASPSSILTYSPCIHSIPLIKPKRLVLNSKYILVSCSHQNELLTKKYEIHYGSFMFFRSRLFPPSLFTPLVFLPSSSIHPFLSSSVFMLVL